MTPDSFDLTSEMMQFPARVLQANQRGLPALRVGLGDDAETVSLSNRDSMIAAIERTHVLDADVLKSNEPFFWPAEISSTRLDSYDTIMDPATTLQNYAEDLIAGVSFCDSHKHWQLGFGRSFAGLFEPAVQKETLEVVSPARVIGAFYTLHGLKTNEVATDDLITSMRGGLTKDVSVGFKPGVGFMYRCSICGLNLWDWDCPHIPGCEYETVDEATQSIISRYAYALIINARLSEVSAVFDGSTPSAMILKATREARAGRIPDRIVALVESRCRVHLPAKDVTIPARKEQETPMTEEQKLAERKALTELIMGKARAVLTGAGLTLTVNTPDEALDALGAEVRRLQPLADEAKTLRAALIDDAVAEGVRALGDKFKEETQRTTLAKLPVDAITGLRDSWKATADLILSQTTGRKSVETDGSPKPGEEGDGTRKAGEEITEPSPALPEELFM